MDLEELVNKHIETNKKKEELQKVRESVKVRFNDLKELESIVMKNCGLKCQEFKNKGEEEIIDFFEKSDFKVTKDNKILIASFNGFTIKFEEVENINTEIKYKLTIGKKKEYNIRFKIIFKSKDMIYWKHNIKINNCPINKFDLSIIAICKDIEELNNANILLQSNIEHYQNTLRSMDDIKFVYSTYEEGVIKENSEDEYDTFEELFESL